MSGKLPEVILIGLVGLHLDFDYFGGNSIWNNLSAHLIREEKFTDIEEMFRRTQVPALKEIGFRDENISWSLLEITPPADCDYYSFEKMIAPKCIKSL